VIISEISAHLLVIVQTLHLHSNGYSGKGVQANNRYVISEQYKTYIKRF